MATKIPLDEIETDGLIYVDVRMYSPEEFMAEQERCQEMIELHRVDDIDNDDEIDPGDVIADEYLDRVNHIEEMRGLWRRMTNGAS